MYIWVILTTFLAIIAGFLIPARSDIPKLTESVKAQPIFAQLAYQQTAAKRYVANKTSKNRETMVKTTKYANGVDLDAPAYKGGKLAVPLFSVYLPVGFETNDAFHTAVYCLDKTKETNAERQLPLAPCASMTSETWLITYGCPPLKWRDMDTGKPSSQLIEAMADVHTRDEYYGYVVSGADPDGNKFGSPALIHRGKMAPIPIPLPIFAGDPAMPGADAFDKVCGANRGAGGCPHCLVYVNVNDPAGGMNLGELMN